MNSNHRNNSSTMDSEAPRRLKPSRAMTEERKRATRACDQCRRLKEKCEGGIPCRRCNHSRRTCEFKSIASQVHESRLHSGSSSRAATGNARELIERSMYMERILKHKFEGISLDTNSLCQMAESITDERPNTNNTDPGDSNADEDDDLAIEEEVCTIDPVEDTTTHYSGEFSYWNFSMRIKRHINDQMTSSNSPVAPDSDKVPDYWRAGQLNTGSNSLTAAISCCPPRHIADFLVVIFFKYAERHYFCVDKTWLLSRLDMLYENPGAFTTKGASTISIILTVFAIGTQYAYLDSPSQNSAGKSGRTGPVFSEDEVGTMFYQQAIRLLPEIIESSSLESVQACLLFGVYALPIDASGLGYIYINLAIRLAMQNGMHRKYDGKALSPAMIETRNRVWWTAYTLERKISIFHGRPLSTMRSDVDSDLPKDRGELQGDNATSNATHMVKSIHLTQRLEDCFNEISSLRNSRKQDLPNIMADLVAMKRALDDWWGSLHGELPGDKAQNPADLRAAMHLRLEYCLIRMFIGRPFLFSRAPPPSNHNSPDSQESRAPSDATTSRAAPNNRKPGSSRAELVDDCIQAAKEALGICRSLHDSGSGLARASYIEYSSCRASLLVLIAYSIQNQSDQFRKPLRDGLDMIRDMSAAGDSARSEVLLIEALKRALTRLHSFGANNAGDDENSSTSGSLTSGYDSFKHWESMWKSGTSANNNSQLNTSRLMPGQPGTLTNFPPRSRVSEQQSLDWTMEDLSQVDDTSFANMNSNAVRNFQSAADLGFFSGGNIPSSSGWPGLSETQVLEEFLAIPQIRFDSGAGAESVFGSLGSSSAQDAGN